MPLSHELPTYLKAFPFYDRLLGRLSEYLHSKYGFLKCIDVGANIGDSIAALYKCDDDSFLAIEPNLKFNHYLHKNWGAKDTVKILNFICSSSTGKGTYILKENAGTASIFNSEDGIEMHAKTLDQIIDDNIVFSNFNLLKIDTDGHDFEIIIGAKEVISNNLPTILFECDSFSNTLYVENCIETLLLLNNIGYNFFLLYDNLGYLMGKHSLGNLNHFRDLLFYQLMSHFYYFDILLMENEDIVPFFQLEQAYFINQMRDKTMQKTANAATKI